MKIKLLDSKDNYQYNSIDLSAVSGKIFNAKLYALSKDIQIDDWLEARVLIDDLIAAGAILDKNTAMFLEREIYFFRTNRFVEFEIVGQE